MQDKSLELISITGINVMPDLLGYSMLPGDSKSSIKPDQLGLDGRINHMIVVKVSNSDPLLLSWRQVSNFKKVVADISSSRHLKYFMSIFPRAVSSSDDTYI